MKKKIFSLLVLLLTAVTGAWAQDTWAEVVFTQAIEANDLAENATFTADGSSFSVTLADEGNKMVIDANACRFGTSTDYKLYSYRLKSGGASSATKNYLILNIPEAGKLRVAPRSASNSATDRTLKIEQGETVLYNDIVQESQAISIMENEQEVKVYPYVEVPVTAGSVRVSYSASMNFYGFGFIASSSGGGSDEGDAYALSVGENAQGSVKFLVGENEVTTAKEGETVTVVITPNTGWVVNQPSGQWIAAEAAARSAVPMLNGFELTKLLGADNSWSFVMERANAEVSVSYKKLLTNSDITIEDITALTYTGQAQEPVVTVKDGSTVLTLGTDYTVAYSNNTNAALATAAQNAPTVTITAVSTSEKYAGDTIKTFTINKADITPTAPVAKTGLVYTAKAQDLITAGTAEGGTMKYSLDNQSYATTVPTGTDAKEYTVYYKVEGDANHNDVAAQNFKVTIVPDTLTEVSLVDTLFMYNFKTPVEQTAEIKEVKTKTLTVPAAQYDIQGNKGTEPGQYTVTVTGKTNFTGSVSTTFTIKNTEIPGTAEETETGKEVNDVKVVVSVVDRTQQTLNIDNIIEATASGKDIIIDIPATVNGWAVTSVSPNAMANLSNVTDIFMPETGETPIQVTDASLQAGDGKATVHAPIQLLDNYANLLPGHVADKKVVSDVMQTAKRFWSFSCGVDVELPAGVTANIVKANNENQVISEPISGNTVKANNGVLLEGDQGVEYTLTAKAATGVGNDYAGNLLEPVVENKHHAYGQGYYILNGGMFYAIANDATSVGSCKAVLHIAGANARVIDIIFDDATGVNEVIEVKEVNDGSWYDLNGRKLQSIPTKKGVYIMNGKKVVVK